MTRKDYVLIADVLARVHSMPWNNLDTADGEAFRLEHRLTVQRCAAALAEALGRDNPRFDRQRFLTACGVQS